MARDVCPSADLNESLGAANQRWKKVYVGEVVEEESNFISRLVTKLASKAAISVSSLSKESIFYRLLSYAFDASGVEYNFNNANAWYICFGDLLGGLIIQGGFSGGNVDELEKIVNFPISFTTCYGACATDRGNNQGENPVFSILDFTTNSIKFYGKKPSASVGSGWFFYIAVGT